MRELSLFTGGGGGLLGTMLLGWHLVGYVEWDEYCQRVIAQRIEDGYLPRAPIFGDIRAFARDGYADAYQGMVDVITAGFPCQPFSVAGKQLGEDDDRNMWPATIDVIRRIQPRWVLLENVPGLVSNGYAVAVVNDLREAGYTVYPPLKLSASDVGANHKRARIWIVAHAGSSRFNGPDQVQSDNYKQRNHTPPEQTGHTEPGQPESDSQNLADADGSVRPEQRTASKAIFGPQEIERLGRCCGLPAEVGFPERQSLALGEGMDGKRSHSAIARTGWWTVEPELGRVANGVAHRVDRLKALGNGQVPLVVATAWRLLTEETGKP